MRRRSSAEHRGPQLAGERGEYPELNAAAAASEGHYRRAIDEGLELAAVADAVADAVQQGRYWVFPQQEFLDLVVRRFELIGQRIDPTPADQTPGLPARSQIVAEARAALGLSAAVLSGRRGG